MFPPPPYRLGISLSKAIGLDAKAIEESVLDQEQDFTHKHTWKQVAIKFSPLGEDRLKINFFMTVYAGLERMRQLSLNFLWSTVLRDVLAIRRECLKYWIHTVKTISGTFHFFY